MTKRDLVKWVEAKQKEAVETAERTRTRLIKEAQEEVYEALGLDKFIDEVHPLFEKFLRQYEVFLKETKATEGIMMSQYKYRYGYSNMLTDYGDKAKFRKELTDMISIDTDDYRSKRVAANDNKRAVEHTYDTVLQTVKNLPTAKDGLEYLKKLGFDISEIQPAEKKKQLPATIKVNVDTKYLLLDREKSDESTT